MTIRQRFDRLVSLLVGDCVTVAHGTQVLELHPRFGLPQSARWRTVDGFGRSVLLRDHDIVYVSQDGKHWTHARSRPLAVARTDPHGD